MTLMGFSSAQFYFNLGDTVILLVSAIFGPFIGMIAGGMGAFFADLAVYPATMFYTLVIKGLEGLIAGGLMVLIKKFVKKKSLSVLFGALSLLFAAFFMMTGYFVCQTFFYGSKESALVALPMDAVQATVSFTVAFVALYPMKMLNFREKVYLIDKHEKKEEDKG